MKPEKIIKALPIWDELRSKMGVGQHLIIYAPQYYNQIDIVNLAIKDNAELSKCVIQIDKNYVRYNVFDFGKLWEEIKEKTAIKFEGYEDIDNANNFQECFKNFIRENRDPITIIVDATSISPVSSFLLYDCFHKCFTDLSIEEASRLSVSIIVLDDYSIYFRERSGPHFLGDGQADPTSSSPGSDFFEPIYFPPLTKRQISGVTVQLFGKALTEAHISIDSISSKIFELSGGHPGFALELFTYLNECLEHGEEMSTFWETAQQTCRDSQLYKNLKSIIQANKLLVESTFAELGKDRHIYSGIGKKLLLHGIINKFDVYIEFCPGLILEIVEEMILESNMLKANSESLASTQNGKLPNLAKPSLIEITDSTIKELDFIAVHISDLHFNEKFPFSLEYQPTDKDRKSVIKMLKDDLKNLGIPRVDALVASGDFASKADMGEFRKARNFLHELSKAIEYTSKIVFVRGNHDLQWFPGAMDSVDPFSNVSSDNFDTFTELLSGTNQRGNVFLHDDILSPDGKKLLRILCLDSNAVEGKTSGGIGYFGQDDLGKAEELLEASNEKHQSKFEKVSTWIVTHHHIHTGVSYSSDEARARAASVTANVPELINFALKHKVEAILHGHEHQPNIKIDTTLFVGSRTPFEQLITLGAGSLSSPREELGPFSKNHYYIIGKKADGLVVLSRALRSDDRDFHEHHNIFIPSEK